MKRHGLTLVVTLSSLPAELPCRFRNKVCVAQLQPQHKPDSRVVGGGCRPLKVPPPAPTCFTRRPLEARPPSGDWLPPLARGTSACLAVELALAGRLIPRRLLDSQAGSWLWTTCIPSCYSSSEVALLHWCTLPHPRYLSSSSSEVVALWRTLHPVPDSHLHLSS